MPSLPRSLAPTALPRVALFMQSLTLICRFMKDVTHNVDVRLLSSLSKKVEVGVDRLGAREAPRPPSRLCSEPFAFCTLPLKP